MEVQIQSLMKILQEIRIYRYVYLGGILLSEERYLMNENEVIHVVKCINEYVCQ